MRPFRPLLFLALLLAALNLQTVVPAIAQYGLPATAAPAPDAAAVATPDPTDVRDLMRLLSDPRIVAWLRQNAEAAPPPPVGAGGSLRGEIESRLDAGRARIVELARAWSNFPRVPEVLADAWRAELSRGDALRSLIYVIVFLFVGGGLEWLYWQYLHSSLLRIEHMRPAFLWRRVAAASTRLMMQAAGLAIFAVGSLGVFLTFAWPPFLERVVVNLLLAAIAIRALAMLSRFVLAPRNPALRLVPLGDDLAPRVHRWHVAMAVILVLALLASDTLVTLARSESGSADAVDAALAVTVSFGAITFAALLAMVWSLTRALARARPPGREPRGRFDPLAFRLLPILQSVVIVIAFVLWVFDATALMWTIVVLGMFLPAARVVRAMVDHCFDEARGAPQVVADSAETETAPAPAAEPPSIYRPIVERLARFALAGVALSILLAAWGTDILALSESTAMSGRIAKVAVDIVAALLIADLVWVWARTAIDGRLARYVAPPPGVPPGPEARMATLLPLLRNMLMIAMIVLVGLTVLSSLGINIAPLLAGAGIAGIAIGFGTQSLVRDIASGIFFLLDDAFRVGEYIEMGNLRGTVESMSIRSMRVRHHRGAVHTIPFGELKSLTNYSRDWVIMKLEFRVPFDTDLKLVKKLIKQIGAELEADPNYGSQIIEPLKSQGVRRMEEFNMVVGVKFMARPGAQWVIRRDAYQKLRDAFEKNGIHFAQRNVKVEVLSEQPLSEDVRRAVTGAAQEAIERRASAPPPRDEP